MYTMVELELEQHLSEAAKFRKERLPCRRAGRQSGGTTSVQSCKGRRELGHDRSTNESQSILTFMQKPLVVVHLINSTGRLVHL